jgi:hypothetical protein
MPRPKSWISRITHILQYLEADTAENYTRVEVEKLFSISASQAADVMQIAGLSRAARPGVESRVSRLNLLHYVKHSPEAQDALQEIERRQRLAKSLRAAEEDLKLRNGVKLRVTKEDDWCRFAELPNVSVQPGLVQIAFTPGDPIDVMDTLWRFVKACGNEWEEFARMCTAAETPADSPTAETPVGQRAMDTLA